MLPCIACTKHVDDDEDEDETSEEAPSSIAAKNGVKSLSSQFKDVVLKVSAAYRQCRPCASSTGEHGLSEEFGTSDASSDEWIHKTGKKGYPSSVGSSISEGASKHDESSKVSPNSRISCNSNGTKVDAPTASEDDTGQEWVAQVEPGVLITFVALATGENELKRIRFSRELFNKWQAEAWWAENCERVHELYNVSGTDHSFPNTRKEVKGSPAHRTVKPELQQEKIGTEDSSLAKSKHDVKTQAAGASSDEVTEWVEEDEPGVYITVKVGPSGNRELKRVRFSREKFSERQAKLWWERNRFRIHDHYL